MTQLTLSPFMTITMSSLSLSTVTSTDSHSISSPLPQIRRRMPPSQFSSNLAARPRNFKLKSKRLRRKAATGRKSECSNVNDDICSIEEALSVIADSARQIAEAITAFTSQKVINWQRVLEKLEELGISQCDVMYIMQLFEKDKELARMFLGITDEAFTRNWVYYKLAQSPPHVCRKILH